jgi:cytosine/adenosine deaminase-related metal-dependent hydrolase
MATTTGSQAGNGDRPVVLRKGLVLTMDDGHRVLRDADVLCIGELIAGIGHNLEVPHDTLEIDAAGGIVMPGMIDTHRHMWQTAMRGYGADWTLTQYFVWYYLQWGKVFRPQDVHAGNVLAAIEAIDAGVTTTVDWSHGRAGQGYPSSWQLRRHGIPVSLSMDTSVWWSADMFAAMRATLSADRSREHLEAHSRQETVTHHHLRAERVVGWATRGGSQALGMDRLIGSLDVGKKADVVLIKNDSSPVMFPVLNPYGHVVYQAQRGDVHTVLVNGRMVKHAHELIGVDLRAARQQVEQTVEYLMGQLGTDAWVEGMHPEIPVTRVLENPYTYTYTEKVAKA